MSVPTDPATDVRQSTELTIDGMTCASCAARIEKKLNKVPGVTASVNYATERAKVLYPPAVNVADLIGVVRNTGYDRWADTNRLVVLFPQAVSIPWKNPNGCWDWWGFTDDDYATRDGIQIRSVRAMIDHLASGRRD